MLLKKKKKGPQTNAVKLQNHYSALPQASGTLQAIVNLSCETSHVNQ